MGPGAAQLKTPPAGMQIVDLMGRITDWADSAALAMEMDLIITVDTAMAIWPAVGQARVGFVAVRARFSLDARPRRQPAVSKHATISAKNTRRLG